MPSHIDKKTQRKRLALSLVIASALVGTGGFLVINELSIDPTSRPAPMPATMSLQSAGQVTPVPNADLNSPVEGPTLSPQKINATENTDKDSPNTATMRLRIPALDASMSVIKIGDAPGTLETGEKRRLLDIPEDQFTAGLAQRSAPCDADQGSTFVVAHNQVGGVRGPLYDLYKLPSGVAAYLTCNSQTTVWKQTSSELTAWANLDQSLFSTTGERRLVVVSCTGRFGEGDNVVKIFTPVQA